MGGNDHDFSEIYIHANWHCKYNRKSITPHLEPALHRFLEEYCRTTEEVYFCAVGGTEDHVHLVFQMGPGLVLRTFLGQIKGASAHEMNRRFGKGTLRWQRGYGVVSFARLHLPGMVRYATHQKEHHRDGTTREILERTSEDWEDAEEEDDAVPRAEARGKPTQAP